MEIRFSPDFDSDLCATDAFDGDGRTHVRQSLLYDFYNLLRFELAGVGEEVGEG